MRHLERHSLTIPGEESQPGYREIAAAVLGELPLSVLQYRPEGLLQAQVPGPQVPPNPKPTGTGDSRPVSPRVAE